MSMISAIGRLIALVKARRSADDMLRHSAHVLKLRSDIIGDSDLEAIKGAAVALKREARGSDPASIAASAARLESSVLRVCPPRGHRALRENVEVAFVAVAVAMGFRTYFLQPFKIPTGSMQPSLYGIHSVARNSPDWTDRPPASQLKWFLTGDSYTKSVVGPTAWDRFPLKAVKYALRREWYVPYAGTAPLSGPFSGEPHRPHMVYFEVGPNKVWAPKDAVMRGELRIPPGTMVRVGDLLWEGTITSGDHLFVNKVAWNFRRPRRGEVTVFSTDGVRGLPPGTHYIKRMIGLPGERISIRPPDVLVDGIPARSPWQLDRIASKRPGYDGFTLAPELSDGMLRRPSDFMRVPERGYFVLGDNTMNSRDGRYWGTVPERSLVGPASIVYWPFSKRWGLVR